MLKGYRDGFSLPFLFFGEGAFWRGVVHKMMVRKLYIYFEERNMNKKRMASFCIVVRNF